MTTLILGRTGSGKDALRDRLQKEYGWNFVQSYTTRPRRSAEDAKSHIFITQEEAGKMRDRVAYTEINGYEYFATRDQVEAADGYIIDPNGAEVLLANDPDNYYQIIYMRPGSTETQRELSIRRADDPEKEARVFDARAKAETEQFDAFERALAEERPVFPGHTNYEVIDFTNTYVEKDLIQLAADLEGHRAFRRNASVIIRDLMAAGILNHTDDMLPMLIMPGGEPAPITMDNLCGCFRENTEMLGDMVYRWMTLPGTVVTRSVPDPDPAQDAERP